MKSTNIFTTLLTAAALAAGIAAPLFADDMPAKSAMMTGETRDIVGVATGENMADVTTLVKLVQAADLVDTLKSKGPFTVFAPTNAAFAKLPKETVDMLLKPENKDKLRAILLFHVVPGNNNAKAVMGMKEAKTAEGSTLMIKEKDGKWYVGNDKGWAQIIKTDIPASNGTIHWIDTVVMP